MTVEEGSDNQQEDRQCQMQMSDDVQHWASGSYCKRGTSELSNSPRFASQLQSPELQSRVKVSAIGRRSRDGLLGSLHREALTIRPAILKKEQVKVHW